MCRFTFWVVGEVIQGPPNSFEFSEPLAAQMLANIVRSETHGQGRQAACLPLFGEQAEEIYQTREGERWGKEASLL